MAICHHVTLVTGELYIYVSVAILLSYVLFLRMPTKTRRIERGRNVSV